MTKTIPGSRVDELSADAEAAAQNAAALAEALVRERRDAEELEPRRRQAIAAHAESCVRYEKVRELVPRELRRATEAIEALAAARVAISDARRRVDRLGASPEIPTPRQLHRTEEGGRALEEIRRRVLVAI